MAEEQVLIRVETQGADAAAAQVAAVGTAAEQSAHRVASAMQEMQSYTSGGITVMVPKEQMADLSTAAEKAAVSQKLVHKEMGNMLPLVGMLSPRLQMFTYVMEHLRYVSMRAGGSLKDMGSAMLGAIKSLVRPEILLAAVAVASIAYAYEKVTATAAAAKKKIEEATEALKHQREEQQRLREEQEKGGQKTAAELTLGLVAAGADVGQLGAVTEAVARATAMGVPDAAARAIGLAGPGKPPPTAQQIKEDWAAEQWAKLHGGETTTPEMRKMIMQNIPEARAMMAQLDRGFAGTPAGVPAAEAAEKITAEEFAADQAKYEAATRMTIWLEEERRKRAITPHPIPERAAAEMEDLTARLEYSAAQRREEAYRLFKGQDGYKHEVNFSGPVFMREPPLGPNARAPITARDIVAPWEGWPGE